MEIVKQESNAMNLYLLLRKIGKHFFAFPRKTVILTMFFSIEIETYFRFTSIRNSPHAACTLFTGFQD